MTDQELSEWLRNYANRDGDKSLLHAMMYRAADAIDRLTRERDEARAALEPFARLGEVFGPEDPEGFDVLVYQPAGYPDIKVVGNDCRRAARAAAKGGGE